MAQEAIEHIVQDFQDLSDMRRGLFDSFSVEPFDKSQNYHQLAKACEKSGEKWTDPLFPPNDRSVFFKNNPAPEGSKIEWKRLSELHPDGRLFKEGVDPGDVNQGDIGNCWFVAGLSLMALKKGLLTRVVPDWHKFKNTVGLKCGMYRFRFWRLGKWLEVVVDDYIPLCNGRMLYVHSKDPGEFWSSLVEKAYAKMSGSYESLVSGLTEDALTDFTGGLTEQYDLGDHKKLVQGADAPAGRSASNLKEGPTKSLFEVCLEAIKRPALLSCSIDIEDENSREARTDMGLIMGHAYAVTAMCKLSNGTQLIQLRNPWGRSEWTGAWSDKSSEWDAVSAKERKRFLVQNEDGSFWMAWDDFAANFTNLAITRIMNTSVFSLQHRWHQAMVRGRWEHGFTAGGCINNKDTFLPQNHQFSLFLERDQTVIVSVMQNDKRGKVHIGVENYSIGFYVFPVEMNRELRLSEFPSKLAAKSGFVNSRENVMRMELARGRYFVMPTTFKQNQDGEFLLRLYSETDVDVRQIVRSVPKQLCPCLPGPKGRLLVHAGNLTGLQKEKASSFLRLSFAGQKTKSFVVQHDRAPVAFASTFVFSLKKPKPLTIRLYHKKLLSSELVGSAKINVAEWVQNAGKPGSSQVALMKQGAMVVQGTLAIELLFQEGFAPVFKPPPPKPFERGLQKTKSRRV